MKEQTKVQRFKHTTSNIKQNDVKHKRNKCDDVLNNRINKPSVN